jgi:hypothetical protein
MERKLRAGLEYELAPVKPAKPAAKAKKAARSGGGKKATRARR